MSDLYDSQKINELSAFFLTTHPWQTWTPTVTQSGAVTVTVTYAKYIALAQTVILRAYLSVTGAGTAGNAIVIGGLPSPLAPAHTGTISVIGTGQIQDTGTAQYVGSLVAVGAADLRIMTDGNSTYAGVTPSFALASGDIISFMASYERA